jgi:hypothetical protein
LVKHEERKKKEKEERTNRKRRKERLFVYTDIVGFDDRKGKPQKTTRRDIYIYNEGIIVASINAKTKDAVTRNTDAQSMNMYTYRARRH